MGAARLFGVAALANHHDHRSAHPRHTIHPLAYNRLDYREIGEEVERGKSKYLKSLNFFSFEKDPGWEYQSRVVNDQISNYFIY